MQALKFMAVPYNSTFDGGRERRVGGMVSKKYNRLWKSAWEGFLSHKGQSSSSSCCSVHFPCTIFLKRCRRVFATSAAFGHDWPTTGLPLLPTCLSCFLCSRSKRSSMHSHSYRGEAPAFTWCNACNGDMTLHNLSKAVSAWLSTQPSPPVRPLPVQPSFASPPPE